VAWPESTPDLVKTSVSTLEARIASIDALHHEAVNMVPDLSDLGGELADVSAELLRLVNERTAAGALPGGINSAALQAAAKAVKPGDQAKVETVFAKLTRWWDQLSTDEQLQVLNGDWDGPALRVNAWLELAMHTVRLLQSNLANGAASNVQRDYADARDRLIADLNVLANTIVGIAAPAPEPEDKA